MNIFKDVAVELTYDYIGQGGYWIINKRLAKAIGLEATILFSVIVTHWRLEFKGEEWFPFSTDDIEEQCTLKRFKQSEGIKKLKELGFIETKVAGIPATTHYSVVANKFVAYMQTELLMACKHTSINNKENNNINNSDLKQKSNPINSKSAENCPDKISPDKTRLNYTELCELVKNDESWIDAICMNLHRDKDFILFELEKFPTVQKMLGTETGTLKDFKRHFTNYVSKTIKSSPQATKQAPDDFLLEAEREQKEYFEKYNIKR